MTPRILVCCLALLAWVTTTPVRAQDPDYVLTLEDANITATLGTQVTVRCMMDNSVGGGVSGWSWGLCQDNANIDIQSVESGAATLTANNGTPAAFVGPALIPGQGWTVGVIVSFGTGFTLPAATDNELHIATYNTISLGTTTLDYCSTLGNPVIFLTVTDAGGTGLVPTTASSTVTVEEGPPPFTVTAPEAILRYDADTGAGSVTVPYQIEENPLNPTFPTETQGFALSVDNDPTVIATAVELAPLVADLNGGAGPSFVGPNLTPVGGNGFTIGVTFSFVGAATLTYENATTVVDVTYETDAAQFVGDEVGTTSPLTFTDTVGNPPVINTVAVNSANVGLELVNGTLFLSPIITLAFVRGDCNVNSFLEIGDGIWLLNFLFQDGSESACPVACDANDDELIDQSDVVYLLNYFFLGGPQPPAPYPDCGVDEVGDVCGSYSFCN